MMLRVPKIDPGKGLRFVLLAQLMMAGILLATDVFKKFPASFRETVELPTGPVSPGDQRREYRTDRTDPELLTIDGPLDLPMPESFSDRLEFSETLVGSIGTVLLVSGEIEDGDAARFQAHIEEMEILPDLIALHSPGGLVFEAFQIGREIRERELSTAVLAGAYCMSSCPYILAAGEERIVSRRAIVGLHQHYYEQPKFMPVVFAVESIQAGQGATMEYLIEMGIAPSLMLFSLKTPPDQIYALVEDELTQTRIATDLID
ncbi:SDH family Clp fold serine proteinase [Shimia thalassica]|uniref:COG3904 family protein n=1 Tax=Shimia thalassica TaxID=1715693 RepID=UPI0026E15CA0|nr:hypothetical protein [Shimia thalassica]MDO6479839.1 hypothetical protein [Shimia thalassica]